jgi:glycosyltransferase involved in cell wall biosynthesis
LGSNTPRPVLLVCQELTQGGSERQLAETARALDRTRFTPHVGCLRPNGIRYEELRAAGIPVETFPVRSFGKPFELLRAALRMGSYLRRNRIELVHSFDTPGNIFAVFAARAFGTPVVLSSQRASRELVSRPYRKLLRFTDRVADAVVVNCRLLEKHLIEEEGVAPQRIRLCYNGIDTRVFHRQEPQRREPLRGASLVIGTVCALRPEKGLATLVEAFAQVRHKKSGMRLAMVGSGPMLADLQAKCTTLGLGEDCLFVPSTSDVAAWLHSIDIFVQPSLSEALSNSLMEAMACGCAVAASRVGGNVELVQDRETGLLFEAADAGSLGQALGTLIEEPEMRQRLAWAGAEFIGKNFSRETAAEKMGAIYDSFLESRPV